MLYLYYIISHLVFDTLLCSEMIFYLYQTSTPRLTNPPRPPVFSFAILFG